MPDHSQLSHGACRHVTCTTCSDTALPVRVVEVIEGCRARVEAGGRIEEVSLDFVDAAAGDIVLVHAGVAIGRLSGTP